MADRRTGTLVYSTDRGRICPGCGSPAHECTCGQTADQPIPVRIVAKLRMEKRGRGGKTVTVVDGLPRHGGYLKALCQELKRACGTGGTVADGTIELQGDLRPQVRAVLLAKGLVVKG